MVSQRFGAERQFGALLSASYSKTRRKVDNLENFWAVLRRPEDGREFLGLNQVQIKDYDSERQREGLTASLEWRPAPAHRLFLRGSFAEFTDLEHRHLFQVIYNNGVLQPGATEGSATFNNARVGRQILIATKTNEITTWSAGGVHDLPAMRIDYTAGFSSSTRDRPHNRESRYRTGTNIHNSYRFTPGSDFGHYSIFDTREHLELNRLQFFENLLRDDLVEEDEWSFQANLRRPFEIGASRAALQFGGKLRSKDRSYDNEQFRERTPAGNPSGGFPAVVGGTPSQNYHYYLGPRIDAAKVAPLFQQPMTEHLFPQSVTADYRYAEDILAGYGQVDLDFGKLDLFAGLRVEQTEFTGRTTSHHTNSNVYTPRRVTRRYTDFFPGVHARYAFSDMLLARAAVTRAINRPNYNDVIPRRTETENAALNLVNVTVGNPDLKQTLSDNLDLFLEYYFKPMGLISGGVFYKDLTDFRFISRTSGTFEDRPAILTRPENARGGRIAGLEFSYQQQFTRLPGLLAGFGLIGNFTYTDSEVTAPLFDPVSGFSTRFRKVQLPGQSKHTYNVSLFYDRGGFNARLSYTARSDYLGEIDVEDGPDFDVWWVGRDQLDFTTSYQLTRRLQLFAEAKNLTNTYGIRYQGQRGTVTEIEQFGYILFGGVRFTY